MSRCLVPIRKLADPVTPFSKAALNWIAFHREFNGAEKAGAIIKVGGRLYGDPVRFIEWMSTGPRISPPGLRDSVKADAA